MHGYDPDWGGVGRLLRQAPLLAPPTRQARCHPIQPHRARGLCSYCYSRARSRGQLANRPLVAVDVNPADLVVLVPMLGRPHHIPPLLDSLHSSVPDARVLFLVSPHDSGVHQAVTAAGSEMLTVPYQARGDYARKINTGYRHTTQPLIFTGASDLRFHHGWFEAACAQLHDGVGVVGTNDLGSPRVIRGDHATHSLVTREYVDKYGTLDGPGAILYEGYVHEFVDDELVGTAKHRGSWRFAADSHVAHLHPNWHPDIPTDPVYAQQARRMQASRGLFQRRRRLWT